MRLASTLFCALFAIQIASGQTPDAPLPISEANARRNLLQHPDPVYPPSAKEANARGVLEIAVVIDTTGLVVSAKAEEGPESLRPAAVDAVKKWTFIPFEADGKKIQVSTTFKIPFPVEAPGPPLTPEQEKARQALVTETQNCREALSSHLKAQAVRLCKQELDDAGKLEGKTTAEQMALAEGHQSYGRALIDAGKFEEALEEENTAFDDARKYLKDSDQELANPIYWRAVAKLRLGKTDAALADFGIAEEIDKRAIVAAKDAETKRRYAQLLGALMRQHARLLDRLGREAEADKLRLQANAL